ncbi:hypothetical protein OG302_27050 [Streptomyces sp. NBC_01283]|uniref:hypothetical protein n=1 Tax=Streptomyces sp. NBC_01283 TaxID=2903812 RepID=UPI00352E93F8|nr:hypothetical protein OG302_27050 [Streptomyces sp. NBC_01283]
MLLYEGEGEGYSGWADAYRYQPGYEDDPDERERVRAWQEQAWQEREQWERQERQQHVLRERTPEPDPSTTPEREREQVQREREQREQVQRERQLERERLEREQQWQRWRFPGLPPLATQAARDALTRWPGSLFHTDPGHVVLLDSASSQGAYTLRSAVGDAHDLLLVHYAGAVDAGDPDGRPSRRGLPLSDLFGLIEGAPARHIVVVLEPDRPTETPTETSFAEALQHRYGYLLRHFQGRLTLIVADPVHRVPRPFLADALGGDHPLSVHSLATQPGARVLMRADGRDVRLTGSGQRGGREPLVRNRTRALGQSLARPALAKVRASTASALSAAAPFALVLLAVALVAGLLFELLRALPPMRGTWAAVVLLGLWAVLAVIGIITRLRTPPDRARPPDKASSPAPRSQAFMDGMWAAWGFPGPVPQPTGRPRQPVPPRPTREESREAVERSLNALYARLPVPQMRAPDPPPSPAAPSSPSPDDNGTTP